MREYTVLARLLSADDSEKKTTAQKTGIWNEQIVFKGLSYKTSDDYVIVCKFHTILINSYEN